uniref:Putative restriction endonuclease n=1 Tax=uncultured bacterium RM44 TaxID=672208 RepID=D3W8M4_9BACT|nr:putative restriction endonuclease [uncultured bacterium RM44]
MGYADVRILDRVHWKGRNRNGGMDMEAYSHTGDTRVRIAATVKQFDRPVQMRYVDELRGTMLRVGARQGLIVSTSGFSPVAVEAARKCVIVPVRLLGGEELLNLLITHQIGIIRGRSGQVQIDTAYFKMLLALYPGQGRRRSANNKECQ